MLFEKRIDVGRLDPAALREEDGFLRRDVHAQPELDARPANARILPSPALDADDELGQEVFDSDVVPMQKDAGALGRGRSREARGSDLLRSQVTVRDTELVIHDSVARRRPRVFVFETL